MRGQLSAEMLILIAVVIAVVAIAATRLISTAKESSARVEGQAGNVSAMAEAALKGKAGDFCTDDSQCLSGGCDTSDYLCR